jgi:hypothetical protein
MATLLHTIVKVTFSQPIMFTNVLTQPRTMVELWHFWTVIDLNENIEKSSRKTKRERESEGESARERERERGKYFLGRYCEVCRA